MAGKMEKDTHDTGEFEGAVEAGNPHAKRPLDKKQGQPNADTSVSDKDKGTVFPSGKVAEEIQALFAGEGLSESFTSKAAVIFEGAISERETLIREQMEASYATKLEEAVSEVSQTLSEKVDSYINYVAETYITENRLAIESGIKNEIAESVMNSVTSIIESAGISLPEDKIDVAEALTKEIVDLESKLNEQTEINIRLTEENRSHTATQVIEEASEGLSDAGKDKLKRLTENLSYSSVADYKSKVAILRETIASSTTPPVAPVNGLNEQLTLNQVEPPKVSDRMSAYIAASKLI